MKRLNRAMLVGALGVGWLAREAWRRSREADLRGEAVLITGGSRGLGFLLAGEFARQGCKVAICARSAEGLERARADLQRVAPEVVAVPCDVGDREQVDRLVDEVTRRFGRIDILVNNAGIIQVGPLAEMTVADFDQAMRTMFWGVLYPTMAVLPQMRERRRGRIVNVTSIGGKVSVPHLMPYTCAKFAAVGLSEGLRAELADQGIVVTTVVPGLMRTGSYLNALFKGQQDREFTWFALGSTLPLISMDAELAARQIVEAARRGDAERTLSIPATMLARFHGRFPGATANLLGLVDRFVLPPPDGAGKESTPGLTVDRGMRSPMLDTLTVLGREAARRFLEVPEAEARTVR